MNVLARILSEAAAREYLGGRDPRSIMPPVKIGGRNCWDIVALDLKLDEMFGVSRNLPDEIQDSALDRWRRNKRLTRQQAEDEALDAKMNAMLGNPPELGLPPPGPRKR